MTDGKYELMTCAALAAGLMFCSGCKTLTGDTDRLKGDHVEIPIPVTETTALGPFVSRDVTLAVMTDPATTNAALTKAMAQSMGMQLQERLRSRGHRILQSGGALVEMCISLREFRPYPKDKELTWRAYVATADVQVPVAGGKTQRGTFVVDGQQLKGKKLFIQESAALSPVQAELLMQVDQWLAGVLKSAPTAVQ